MEAREIKIAGRTGLLILVTTAEVQPMIRRIGEAMDISATPETVFPERDVVGCMLRPRDVEYFIETFPPGSRTDLEQQLLDVYAQHEFSIILQEDHCRFYLMLCHEIAHLFYEYDPTAKSIASRLWNAFSAGEQEEVAAEMKQDGYKEYDFIDEAFARIVEGAVTPAEGPAGRAAVRLFTMVFGIATKIYPIPGVESYQSGLPHEELRAPESLDCALDLAAVSVV